MTTRNPLSFSARTFITILFDLKTNYPDKPEWFQVWSAALFDILHWYLDERANNNILESAYTPEAVDKLVAYLDYFRTSSQPSSGDISVSLKSGTSLPLVVTKDKLKFTLVKEDGSSLQAEALADVTFTDLTQTISIIEGQTVDNLNIGRSNDEGWQRFVVANPKYISGSGKVAIDNVIWEIKDDLVNSDSTDKHVRIIKLPEGKFAVQFGDDTFAEIPPVDFDILFSARYGGGIIGNFSTTNARVVYIGGSADIDTANLSFVSAKFSGGEDEESIDTARILAPQFLKINNRAITESDYQLLSLKFSTGIQRIKVLPGYYGPGTIGIHIVPSGGGNPSTLLKQSLQDYLISVSPLSNADVRVRDANYVSQNITVRLKMRTNADFSLALPFADVFVRILVDETGAEVTRRFGTDTIVNTTLLINSLYTKTFGSDDYGTLEILLKILVDSTIDWGGRLNPGDVFQIIESIPGVSYSEVDIPAVAVIYDSDKTPTIGTVSITEIP